MSIVKLDIINHADYCGEFKGDKYIPGLRKFYNAIESIRSKNPDNTLLLDAGDEINRLLWYGHDVLDGLALIKTDAMVIGNHEFDRGQTSLEDNLDYLNHRFYTLCANIIEKKTGNFIKNCQPYTILEKSGIKIGIVGVTTEYTEKMITFPNFEPYQTLDPAETINKYVPMLRQKGAEIIIVLAHIGSRVENGEHVGELFDVLKDIKESHIDMFVGGHLMGDIYQEFDGVMVNKGGFSGKSLLHSSLYFDTDLRKVVKKEAEVLHPILEKYNTPNTMIDSFVDKVLAPFDLYFNDVLAIAKEDIIMQYTKEGAQGNLFADAVRYKAQTDFSYFNTTSCGPRIAEGPITRYSIKQAIYFDEQIHTTTMTGQDIKDLFEQVHNPNIYSKNFNLYFSGLIVTIDHTKEYLHKVISMKYLDGREVKMDDILTVASSAYMASGGNDTRMIANRCKWDVNECYIHDAIKDYLIIKKEVDNSIDNRYIFIGQPQQFDISL